MKPTPHTHTIPDIERRWHAHYAKLDDQAIYERLFRRLLASPAWRRANSIMAYGKMGRGATTRHAKKKVEK